MIDEGTIEGLAVVAEVWAGILAPVPLTSFTIDLTEHTDTTIRMKILKIWDSWNPYFPMSLETGTQTQDLKLVDWR